jgi:hypothetical protein
MLVLVAIMLQSDPASGPPASSTVRLTPRPDCPVSNSGDIIVCARKDNDQFRLKPLSQRYSADPQRIKAETHLNANTALSAETEAGSVGGFVSNRIMARLKWKF